MSESFMKVTVRLRGVSARNGEMVTVGFWVRVTGTGDLSGRSASVPLPPRARFPLDDLNRLGDPTMLDVPSDFFDLSTDDQVEWLHNGVVERTR